MEDKQGIGLYSLKCVTGRFFSEFRASLASWWKLPGCSPLVLGCPVPPCHSTLCVDTALCPRGPRAPGDPPSPAPSPAWHLTRVCWDAAGPRWAEKQPGDPRQAAAGLQPRGHSGIHTAGAPGVTSLERLPWFQLGSRLSICWGASLSSLRPALCSLSKADRSFQKKKTTTPNQRAAGAAR